MKNKLIRVVFILVILLLSFVMITDASAQTIDSIENGNNSVEANVTVGNVDAPVYRTDLWWDSLTFDWEYNEYSQSMGWKPADLCVGIFGNIDEIKEEINDEGSGYTKDLYTDSTCTTKVDTYDETARTYYYLSERTYVSIGIRDYSVGAEIIPSIEWNSSEKYNNVVGKILYRNYHDPVCTNIYSEDMLNYALENNVTLYSDNTCSIVSNDNDISYGEVTYYAFVNVDSLNVLEGNEVPDEARYAAAGVLFDYRFTEMETKFFEESSSWLRREIYKLEFFLENKSLDENFAPKQGDIIGSLTISIRVKDK